MIHELEKKINYKFNEDNFLREALIHSSFADKKTHLKKKNYERLEFLGDRVLGLVLAEYFFKTFPDATEGTLNNYYQSHVNQGFLATYAKNINLAKFIMIQKGDNLENNQSVLSDVVEAIIGAIYLDSNLKECKKFIVKEIINKSFFITEPKKHSKTALQELCLKKFKCLPKYEILEKSGIDHRPIFKVSASIENFDKVIATGSNVKNAEEAAASKLFKILNN